jgi:geranylgeranyl pyrophosphate synthase
LYDCAVRSAELTPAEGGNDPVDELLASLAVLRPSGAHDAPATEVALGAADLVRRAFGLHHLLDDAECGREELLLGDLCLVLAADLVAGLDRSDVEVEFARGAMAAATGEDHHGYLAAAVAMAGRPRSEPPGASVEPGGGLPTDVDARLDAILAEDPPMVAGPMQGLLAAGGKRVRPRLAILCSGLGPQHDAARAATLGCVFELIHDAALVHDDLVDQSPVRRGRPSVHVAHGTSVAVRVGDYYFGRSAALLAGLASHQATRLSVDAVVRVCRAQLDEYRSRGLEGLDEARYIETVEGKTAALFAGACASGAALAGADTATVRVARDFGRELGIAFQIADDVLDFSPSSGKPLLQDLRQGVTSLPLLYALRDPVAGPRLRAMDDGELDAAVAAEMVVASGALDAARARAREHRDLALAELGRLPAGSARDELEDIARAAVDREA